MKVPATKYGRIMADIRSKIISGKYPLDSKLPSEVQLQKEYGVSRVTVRLAIDELVKDGLVERVQGKGSYVRKPQKLSRLVRTSAVESFSAVAKASGYKTSTKLLKIETIKNNDKLKQLLKNDNEDVLHTVRLRFLDNDPIFIENNYYPLPRFKNLAENNLNGSLYKIFKQKYGIKKLISDNTILSVKIADVEEANLLKRSIGFPLYLVKTQVCDENQNVVQYGEEIIASDRYQFKI